MAYGLSDVHVTDDATWSPKVPWGSTVGYSSDSLAFCLLRNERWSSSCCYLRGTSTFRWCWLIILYVLCYGMR